jgi:four helix bundle protein
MNYSASEVKCDARIDRQQYRGSPSAPQSKRFVRFLRQSKGSLAELLTQTVIASRRRYLKSEVSAALEREAVEVDRMLSGVIASLGAKIEADE